MNFEHLVEINDLNNPILEPLSRNQLWQGLVLRAENPELSVIGLDACIMHMRGDGYLRRELRFGQLSVHDEVFLDYQREVRYEVAASEHFPASSLSMRIEEPYAGGLFLRFTYASPQAQDDEMVREHVKQAYIEADNDTVAVIRKLAALGKLGDYTTSEQGLN